MLEPQALSAFAALSQETRLRNLRTPSLPDPRGWAAGAVAERVAVSASNVSFHLKALERAGLVRGRRDGRSIVYGADFACLSGLVRFLLEDCRPGHPEICLSAATAAACCAASETS